MVQAINNVLEPLNRCSGASLAFNYKVDFEEIKSQGAWSSDAVYKYLFANSETIQEVPHMFETLESQLVLGVALVYNVVKFISTGCDNNMSICQCLSAPRLLTTNITPNYLYYMLF